MISDDQLARQAAEWIVALTADSATARRAARQGFEDWKRSDPRHAAAAATMERFVMQAEQVRGPACDTQARPAQRALRAALDATLLPADPTPPRAGRLGSGVRRTAGVIAVLLAVASMATVLAGTPQQLLADLCTSVGEQRSETLADGTTLTLATASALNYQLGETRRQVELLRGEVLLDVAKDPQRPLVIDTPQGHIRALGTRFIVRREGDATVLTMLESSTAVSPAHAPAAETVVAAGQQVRISAQGVQRVGAVSPGLVEDAFRQRRLVAHDRPLAEVLDELARHRRGLIRYEAAAIRHIRVTAVLPLDDPGRALRLLAANFPQLGLREVTPWLVFVDARH